MTVNYKVHKAGTKYTKRMYLVYQSFVIFVLTFVSCVVKRLLITFYIPMTIDDNSLHNYDSDSFSEVQLCITN
jgi:hypothetical protein